MKNISIKEKYNTPEDYFNTLRSITPTMADESKFKIIDRVFHLSVDGKLKESNMRFSGFFSKVDFLLKEKSQKLMDKSLPMAVNNLRIDLKNGKLEKDAIAVLCAFIGLIYDVDVPDDLRKRYPFVRRKDYHPLLDKGNTIRVVVIRADNTFIYATREDSGNDCKIAYTMGFNSSTVDRSYMKVMLSPGMQLNIVKPRVDDDGVVYPEFIIVNPDSLIDISSIAACFDDYGDSSPYTYIINRLKPAVTTEPILLGNFASQLLDEMVNRRFKNINESYRRFVCRNALSFSVSPVSDEFIYNAGLQYENISHAISSALPEIYPVKGNAILEPTFYSETLGLQGRMDFLTDDYRVLIEQKSGRGAYNPQDEDTPRIRTTHYVQLLLYRALLHYGGFNSGDIYSFLLYSKYANSLVSVGNAPVLLFNALKTRNQIAWLDLWLSYDNHISMLSKLTPEKISPRGHGYGWDHFTRPQIAHVVDTIRQAAPLEQAYYYRFMRFVETENTLSKLGNRTKEGSGFASTWNDTPAERRATGNLYDGLRIKATHSNDEGQIDAITFTLDDNTDTDVSNFREGDVVMFYSYNPSDPKEPLATRHLVFRGTILALGDRSVEISFRDPQLNKNIIEGDYWAVEHDHMESSTTSLYRGLQSFLKAPLSRRKLILSQREPETDTSLCLKGDYTNRTTGDKEFNDLVLRVKQAKDFFLIIGPPGTGKTSYGMLNVLKEQLLDADSSVLVMAYTNRAVDELCEKMVDDGIDFIRIGSYSGCDPRFRKNMLEKKVEGCESVEDIQKMIHSTRVFCGTTTSFNSNILLLKIKRFALAIIDEASQILEPQIIGLLSAEINGEPSIRKFVLIGDEKQLPAVVQQSANESIIDDELLNKAGITDCRMSFFERLMRTYRKDGKDNQFSYMLTRQGRMHPDIADFPNKAFYGGKLRVVPLQHQKEESDGDRVRFFSYHSDKNDLLNSSASEKANKTEAVIIAHLVFDIWKQDPEHFDNTKTVGVIVPYRNQVSTIRKEIEKLEMENRVSGLSKITIDTVERYQGSQREVIIYGFTVKYDYQLDFLTDNQYFDNITKRIVDRKLNVAMTRAMKYLYMVGNPQILRKNEVFNSLIEYLASKNCIINRCR